MALHHSNALTPIAVCMRIRGGSIELKLLTWVIVNGIQWSDTKLTVLNMRLLANLTKAQRSTQKKNRQRLADSALEYVWMNKTFLSQMKALPGPEYDVWE